MLLPLTRQPPMPLSPEDDRSPWRISFSVLENRLEALVRLHTPLPPGPIGGAAQPGMRQNLRLESFNGPNAGLTEVLIPAGYVTTVYDPMFALSPDGTRYVSVASDTPATLPEPGLTLATVIRGEP